MRAERSATRKWFKSVSDLRGKERSLLHGDYAALSSSSSSMVFLRQWDQSDRFLTAVNWGDADLTLTLDTGTFRLYSTTQSLDKAFLLVETAL